MVPYMSYWCGGYRKQPSEMILLMHKIACYFAKQHYGECHMLTDSISKDWFKDCGYTSIVAMEELDKVPYEYDYLWSIGKIIGVKEILKKQKPFLHLDYDVFLFKKLPKFIDDARVFVQSPEHTDSFYELSKFHKHCKKKYLLENPKTLMASNMGIFGGTDLEFWKIYADEALKLSFDPENKPFFTTHNWNLGFNLHCARAIIVEQYCLNVVAEHYNVPITNLSDSEPPTEEECTKLGYTHLWAAKDNEYLQQKVKQIAQKLNL